MARRNVTVLALAALLAGIWVSAAAPQAVGQPKEGRPEQQFVRLLRDQQDSPIALQMAIVRCVPLDRGQRSPIVDLIAGVHIAEKSYYQQLNKEFQGYDSVLYELVAPEEIALAKVRDSSSVISVVQKAINDVLQLEFQLEVIDYTRKNMVHADMTPAEFSKSMRDRGESYWAMLLRIMGYAMSEQHQQAAKLSDTELLLALFRKDRVVVLKRLLAEQFEDLQGPISALEGPKGSTLVSQRNKVALAVLRREIAAGKRKIAIFYGAGHMPDLVRRLGDDFGLTPVRTRWLVAWDLKTVDGRR